jgi:hypothetical protein
MASALAQGAAKFCHVWLIERRDGVTLGFTDHDQALECFGVTCQAQSGLTAGAAGQDIGEAGNTAVSGAISSDAIRVEDVAAGRTGNYLINRRSPIGFIVVRKRKHQMP